ncbi:MAG: glycosyltransferase [Solirubrobacterales bacterium]|nr:glycosyltransferase [Solirubrobacterales bacterium]
MPAVLNREPLVAGRDIVCVGFNDWEAEVWTNQHHLMARFAAHNRVLFVESLGLRRPTVAPRDVRRMARRLRRGLHGAGRPRATGVDGVVLNVVSPLVLPVHASPLARRVNASVLPWQIGRAAADLSITEPILWAYVPQAELLLDRLNPSLVVYHCVDDIAAHPRIDTATFRAAERRLARRADIVLASSRPLADRMRGLSSDVHCMTNVADVDLFAAARLPGPVDPAVAALPEPRIVFTGVIAATKVDVLLLIELATLRPDWSIVLAGPVGLGDPHTEAAALASIGNVHLIGSRPYAHLPAVLRGAQAAIIPYLTNELTAAIFPMKVYEYLAAGLPVVATPLPSLQGLDGISFAAGAGPFVAELERLMAEDDLGARAARARLAEGQSWDARMREIAQLIEDHRPR